MIMVRVSVNLLTSANYRYCELGSPHLRALISRPEASRIDHVVHHLDEP